MSITSLLNKINQHILNPLIALVFAIALVVFFWGIVEFIMNPNDNRAKEQGKQNILWGLVGMFIMVGVYGIIRLILNTFGIPNPPYLSL